MAHFCAAKVEDAFWSAAKRLDNDKLNVFTPYFDREMDMVDTSGCGMPQQFWEYMAEELNKDD